MSSGSRFSMLFWACIVRAVVLPLLAGVLLVSWLGRLRRPSRSGTISAAGRRIRVLAVGTFHNPNWPRSHLCPIAAAPNVSEVLVVCPEALFPADRLTYECPPAWLARLTGRSMAKVLWFFRTVVRRRPEVLMGYHIMPNAVMCLAAARLLGLRAIYQMTGGPVQLIGGGYASEGGLVRRLGYPSALGEALMMRIVRHFDAVVVRGEKAAEFLRRRGLSRSIAVITGSVDTGRFAPRNAEAEYDLVSVGRLVPVKRPELFLGIVESLARRRPATRAAVVGDGPMLDGLRNLAGELGIQERVDFTGKIVDVQDVLDRSRLFVLTSRNEGVSIAMLEGMACGLVPVVPDVGELAEFVSPGVNGLFIEPTDPDEAAERIAALLDRSAGLAELAAASRRTVETRCSVPAVAERWRHTLESLVGQQ
jgi:glycosyltransferase involved in cell wall biosynthesis